MNNYQQILRKLEGFIRKYYTNELIKGALLFFAIGLLYLLISVAFEYFFWFGKQGRSILFGLFIVIEVGLFFRFLAFPLLKLLKLSKGIDYYQASKIIGRHFPQVRDKLLNVLQLQADQKNNTSDLLLASIDQKAANLQPIPFQLSIDFRGNLKYVKYAVIPLLMVLVIYSSGKSDLFSESYTRMVNYRVAYEPPAPFSFVLLNSDLHAQENEKYTIKLQTQGNVVPEEASIHYNGQRYFLKQISPGHFEFTFDRIKESMTFYFSANKVKSKPYTLAVSNVPSLLSFEMELDYPTYLHKKNEILKGTGSATVPEGTKVFWKLRAKHTNLVTMEFPDTTALFSKSREIFEIDRQVFSSLNYGISTSNKEIKDYEKLSYQLKVVPDERPEIAIEMKKDTLNEKTLYFHGKVSDDYGLSKLQLVVYPTSASKKLKTRKIKLEPGNYDEFVYAFPDTLDLKEGVAYEFYFQVFDNDGVNGSKSSRSNRFNYRKPTKKENREKQLQKQERTIEGMDNSLREMKEGNKDLKAIDRLQKQKSQLNYSDRQKVKRFVERQQHQERMMKNYSRELKDNLENFESGKKKDGFKRELGERLERNEKKLQENEKLLEKLKKYQDKINKEELNQKIEQLAKHNQNEQKNLEQLVELTKRYYVHQKAESVAADLKDLGKKQGDLSKKNKGNTSVAQHKMNEEFGSIQKTMDALEKENEALKAPMELKRTPEREDEVKEDQKSAEEDLKEEEEHRSEAAETDGKKRQDRPPKKGKKSSAQQKQRAAAETLKKLGEAMQMQLMQSGGQQQAEDAKMLRQVLNNLLKFSFQQEDLMEDFQEMGKDHPDFAPKLRHQKDLKENFEHIDDSLYALALRNPIISEKVTEKLTEVSFNMEKALERLAQNELRTGVASQHYVFKNTNDLAVMLDESLLNMQQQLGMNAKGGGKGKEGQGQGKHEKKFQLPDLIKKQGELGESMKEVMKKQEDARKNERKGKGTGEDDPEEMSGELYEIFKKQQKLRDQLEDMIEKEGLGDDAQKLTREMKNIEQKLLEKGFNRENEKQMQLLQHQLLKLKDALLKQGEEHQREATTNKERFENENKGHVKKAKEYFNTTEILNRQRLPLRENYQIIVQDYFRK